MVGKQLMVKKNMQSNNLLRSLREARGKSTEKVAKVTGVNRQIVYRAEQQEIITNESAEKIAKFLGISAEIMFYNMGKFPPEKLEFIKKDPIFFKELIDDACKEPWKLTTTKEYVAHLKNKIKDIEEESKISPEISKILEKLKPCE